MLDQWMQISSMRAEYSIWTSFCNSGGIKRNVSIWFWAQVLKLVPKTHTHRGTRTLTSKRLYIRNRRPLPSSSLIVKVLFEAILWTPFFSIPGRGRGLCSEFISPKTHSRNSGQSLQSLDINLQSLNIKLQSLNVSLQRLNISLQSLNIKLQSLNISLQSLNLSLQSLFRSNNHDKILNLS